MPLPSRSRRWITVAASCLAALLSLGRTAAAQPVLDLQPVASGFSSPVGLVNARDGSNRLFIVEQGGTIKIYDGSQVLATPFLNITSRVLVGRRTRPVGTCFRSRDWGFAGDYVEGMWRTLQQSEPEDFVFATGLSTSIRTFVELAAENLGMPLEWSGSGLAEAGIDRKTGRTVVDISPAFFRPVELRETVGDAQRARDKLGWAPVTDLPAIVAMMVAADERRLLENRPLD